jgi:hypothetical protein
MTHSKRFWLVVFALVLCVHLLLILLLGGLLGPAFSPPPSSAPVSIQILAAPPQMPKRALAPTRPIPAPKASSIAEAPEVEASRPPGPEPLGQAESELAYEEFFESSLEDGGKAFGLEELSKPGAVAMTAYWGDFASGSPIGHSTIELSFPKPDRYQIKMVTEAAGWARLFASAPMLAQAEGSLGAGGFLPERYSHQGPRRSEVTVFDYSRKEIRYESLKEPLPLLNGIQDRLTFMLQLAWMLQTDPERFSLGQTVTVPIAGRNKVEEVDFLVLSDADLALPSGVLVPALHLSSNRQTDRYSVQIDVWMDRTDRLLPVRIRFEEARGAVLDLLTVRN